PPGAEAPAVEQRIEEVVGVRVIRPPVEEHHVGLALARRLTLARGVPLHQLHAHADPLELRLDRLRDTRQLHVAPCPPQLRVESPNGTSRTESRPASNSAARVSGSGRIRTPSVSAAGAPPQ